MKRVLFVSLLISFSTIGRAQKKNDVIYSECPDIKTNLRYSESYKVDKCPEFPGGLTRFLSYIMTNLRLPKKVEPLPGRMLIEMVVEKDGGLNNPVIIAGRNKKINNEVLRLFRKSPKWQPATFKDKPVRCYYEIPLTIDLSQS